MSQKRILLIGGNFSPELTGIGKYNGEMFHWLASQGYQCTVITTVPYYPQWKVQKPYSNRWFKTEVLQTAGKPIEIYRCPFYVPKNPTGARRLLSEISFSVTAFFALLPLLFKRKFDFVITVVPPFQIGFHALLYSFLKRAKFLYHIQDLQIEAAQDLGLIRSKTLVNFLLRMERFVLKRADVISTISEGMVEKVQMKTGRAVSLFPNWVDTERFFPIANRALIKEQYGFSASDKIVLYSGAIGEKQGLEIILHAAKGLATEKDIRFVICGSGPYKEQLEARAKEGKLANIVFMGLQPNAVFNEFLNMADVHLVIQKGNASDLVLPSKLTTILSVGGLPLVTAVPGTTLYKTIVENKLGIVCEPENEAAFIRSVIYAVRHDHCEKRRAARCYAENHLSIDAVLSAYSSKLDPKKIPAPNQLILTEQTV